MLRNFLRFTFLAACLLAASFASADSQTWDLVGTSDSSKLPCTMTAPCASVTINASGNNAIFTVTSLLNGYVFDTFGFNTINGVSVSLVAGSGTGELGSYSLGGSGNEDGWGSFKNNFDTGKNGGSNGGDCANHGAGCTFSFKVSSASSLSVASFEFLSSGGNGSGYFAGHMASSSNKSGYSGDSQIFTPIPEPATMAVLVPGLLVGIVLLGRQTLILVRQASS